jgi:hypothetical protein
MSQFLSGKSRATSVAQQQDQTNCKVEPSWWVKNLCLAFASFPPCSSKSLMATPPSTLTPILHLPSILTPTRTQLQPRLLLPLSASRSPPEGGLGREAQLAVATEASGALLLIGSVLLLPGVRPMAPSYVKPVFSLPMLN